MKACAIRDLEMLQHEIAVAVGNKDGVLSRMEGVIVSLRQGRIRPADALLVGIELRGMYCGSY